MRSKPVQLVVVFCLEVFGLILVLSVFNAFTCFCVVFVCCIGFCFALLTISLVASPCLVDVFPSLLLVRA